MLLLILASQIFWIDEIVVTATRYPDPLLRIPVSVALIGSEELNIGFDLNDVLSSVAGIQGYTYGYGSLNTIGIRGLPSDETLVLLDGLPVNSIATGVGDVSFVPTELIKRVEVVKGPVSSLYGGNAVGGVVNIELRRDNFFKTGIGNQGYWGLHTSGSFGEVFHILGGGTHWDGDRTNDDLNRYFLAGGIKLKGIGLELRYSEKSFGVPGPVPGDYIPEFGDSTATAIGDREFDQRIIPNLSWTIRPAERIVIKNKTYLNYCRIDFRSYYRSCYPSFPALEHDYYRMANLGNELETRWDLPFDNRLGIGITYDYDSLDTESRIENDSTKELVSEDKWHKGNHRFGVFIEDRQTVSNLDLFLALRYDWDRRFPSQFSPSAGLSLLLTDWIRLRSHWGIAYRRPTFNDLYWPNGGNPDLVPEHGIGSEAGIDLFLPSDLIISLSGFYRRVTDKIAWVPTGNLWSPENINRVESYGGEVELRGKIFDLLSLDLNYTYLDPKSINQKPVYYDTTTKTYRFEDFDWPLINTPKHSASLRVSIDLLLIRAGISYRYTGRRYCFYPDYSQFPEITYQEKSIAPSAKTDLFLSLTAGNFTISFIVFNLTDRTDPIQFGNTIDDHDYPQAGRSFRFELSQKL